MKADHRHELKTNTLAEWLGNFPEWARENLISVIIVLVTIVAVVVVYVWRSHNKSTRLQEQLRFTGLVNQVSNSKMQILNSQVQGTGRSSALFGVARNLDAFANSTSDDNLAATALIKQAEALRAELHYRAEDVPAQELVQQVGRAKQSYTKAVERAGDNPSLVAAAKFGLGLCEEELGNFKGAQQIYGEIVEDPAFEGTLSVAQAKLRLDTMDDYKTNIVFVPKPKPRPVEPPKPIMIQPADANSPVDANRPANANKPVVTVTPSDVNTPVVTKEPVIEANLPAEEPNISPAMPETKPAAVEPNSPTETADVNAAKPDPNSVPEATKVNVRSR